MKNKDDSFYIRNIRDFCVNTENVISDFSRSYEAFEKSVSFQCAISFCVIQIGENANKLSDEFCLAHSEVKWRQIASMRKLIVHNYGGVRLDILWDAALNDIPALLCFCEAYLTEAR